MVAIISYHVNYVAEKSTTSS